MVAKHKEEKSKLISEGLRNRSNPKSYGSVPSVDKIQNTDSGFQNRKTSTTRGECIYIVVVLTLAILGIIIGEATLLPIALDKIEKTKNCLISVDPGVYPEAAVSTDDYRCSQIARDLLLRDGSAVDAAIAAMLCIGVVVPQSSGIAGGHFMSIYHRSSKTMITLNSREKAPLAATKDMLERDDGNVVPGGPKSIAVPGEISGMWEAHQKFGRLPWTSLFEDSIRLCKDGSEVSSILADSIRVNQELIMNNTALKNIFWNKNTSSLYKEGEILKRPKLGDTLQRISIRGRDEFYKDETARILVKDIQEAGGVLTKEDFTSYQSSWAKPVQSTINDLTAFGPPAPSATSYLLFILNVLHGYNLTPDNTETVDDTVLTYHRFIEALKFGRALSSKLVDPKFSNLSSEAQKKLASKSYADEIRKQIDDKKTYDVEHYKIETQSLIDHGTSHISVLAPDGSGVSVTTSVNYYFGSGIVSPSTGIILNDNMDDFSQDKVSNIFELKPEKENYIQPTKQAASSMSPMIVVNTTSGNITTVIGASGGSKIPSSVTQVYMLTKWLGNKLHVAAAKPRIHHQLEPNELLYDPDFPIDVLNGLKKKGHNVEIGSNRIISSAVNAIFHLDKCIRASSDPQKGGMRAVEGF